MVKTQKGLIDDNDPWDSAAANDQIVDIPGTVAI
jgi:hypothetical protein